MLDGDEMTADPDDGDAGHYSGTNMVAHFVPFSNAEDVVVARSGSTSDLRKPSVGPTRHTPGTVHGSRLCGEVAR